MAKVHYFIYCLLLLCYGCHNRIPEAGLETDDDTAKSKLFTDSVISTVQEAPVLAQVEAAQERREIILQQSRKNIPVSVVDVYLSQIGVREKTGHNDGKDIEKYLRSVGLGKGYAWCAAYVRWCFDSAGVRTTINGAAASAHNSKDLVWFHKTQLKIPQPGDVFTLWYNALNRIGHTGFYHRTINSTVYESVEGNTNEAGSREGDGVYKKYRSFNATYSISRWVKQ